MKIWDTDTGNIRLNSSHIRDTNKLVNEVTALTFISNLWLSEADEGQHEKARQHFHLGYRFVVLNAH